MTVATKKEEEIGHCVYAGVPNSVLAKITGAEKGIWYKDMVDRPILLKLYKTKRDATSVSMPDRIVLDKHFKIIKGIDVRAGENNKVYGAI
jgi:hypothetical protein